MSRRVARALSGAIALAALAPAVFGPASASAAPATVSAVLTLDGVQTAAAPGGTDTVNVTTGDSVRFSAARPDRIGAAIGYYVILDTHAFTGSHTTVKLSGSNTYTARVATAGLYSFSWTPYTALGVRIKLKGSEYTAATVVAADPATSNPSGTPTGSGGSSGSAAPTGTTSGSHAVAGISTRAGGFGAPAPDTGRNSPHTTPAGSTGVLIPLDPSSITAPAAVAGPTSDPNLADVASVVNGHPARPTGLAITAILALAIVAVAWVYQYMGLPLPAAAARWLNRPQ